MLCTVFEVSDSHSSPGSTIGTCCKGTFPGREFIGRATYHVAHSLPECALGTYCSGSPLPSPLLSGSSAGSKNPSKVSISSRADPTLPGNWTVAGPCMIRSYDTILHTTTTLNDNTPANCAAFCGAGGEDGYPYTMAGVSNGTSCHCGDSYSYIFADRAYEDECNQLCAGDPTQTCGRHDRVQVYTRREIPEKPFLPVGWREVQKCAVDTVHRIFDNITITQISQNTHWVCAKYCQDLGPQYLYAGTEDGAECHCGTGYKGGIVPPEVGFWECDTKCAGHGTIGCGGSWRINVYSRA